MVTSSVVKGTNSRAYSVDNRRRCGNTILYSVQFNMTGGFQA